MSTTSPTPSTTTTITETATTTTTTATTTTTTTSTTNIPVTDPCEGIGPLVISGTTSGYITSPNYPMTYPTNVQCTWVIEVESGMGVKMSFDNLDIEVDEQCR